MCFRQSWILRRIAWQDRRKALFGEEAAAAYDILNNRLAFVEGGQGRRSFSRAVRPAGKLFAGSGPLRDVRRAAARFPEGIGSGGESGQRAERSLASPSETCGCAMASRGEIARLEEEHSCARAATRSAGSLMGRVGFGSDPASLRAAMTDVEKRLRLARSKAGRSGSAH